MSSPVTVPDAGDLRSGRWIGAVSMPLPRIGEERLARLAGEGDERAFAALYERYQLVLYRYCRSLVRNDTDAQDALQSTFMAALAALRRGQRDAPLRPWLFRIAHNESVSLLRRRRPEDALSDAIESTAPSVEQSAEARARLASLVADLGELPERQRGALLMRELSGLSHEEIAEALGVTLGAAKQTIFEARRSLVEFAEGRKMACEEIQRVISDCDGRALRARRVRAHLRDCSRCAAFAAAIPAREADLLALSPALPIAAASGILARVTAAGPGHGSSTTGLVAGATGKVGATALSLKAITAGVAVVAAAGAGAAGVLNALPTSHARTPARHGAPIAHPPSSRTSTGSVLSGVALARHGAVVGQEARQRALANTGGAAGSAKHRGRVATSTTSAPAGNSGTTLASRVGSGATNGQSGLGAHPGSANHPTSTSHPGSTSHRGSSSHLSSTSHPGSSSHPSSTSHPGSSSHPGSTSHPSSTSHPQPPASSNAPSGGPASSTGAGGSGHTAAGPTPSSPSDTAGPPASVPGDVQSAASGSSVTTPTPTSRKP
jgi:RNA polymerase sigma factor (sigma-70 family)